MEENKALDLGSLGSFDFTPDWAKKDAGVTHGKVRPERESPERSEGSGRKPSAGSQGPSTGRRQFAQRRPAGERRPRFEERSQPLAAEVKVLPETKALGTIMRKIQGDAHAYKLKDLALFFLDNQQSILLKISPRAPEGQPAGQNRQPQRFFQCKACGFVSTRQEDVIAHALGAHLADYYDSMEVECEPPKGNFNCVARCGLSGVLLGPPNIHEFGGIVREMVRTRYPEMSEDQYRAHIEMVRDADVIEQWRQSAVKKTVLVAKGGDVQLSREQAEGEFRRLVLPSLVDTPKNVMITADVALKSPVRQIVWAVRDAIEAERRSPYGMLFALRGAFHHRKFNFFRVNDARGTEFVTAVALKEFDIAHAVPELAKVAQFISDHPCCAKTDLPDDPETLRHLNWLVSTGHVVAFTNGVYSAVEKYPKYGPQWRKRKKDPEAKAEEAPASVDAPVEAKAEEVKAEEVKVEEAKVEEVKDESTTQLAE